MLCLCSAGMPLGGASSGGLLAADTPAFSGGPWWCVVCVFWQLVVAGLQS